MEMVTASGEKHGLINRVANSVPEESRFKGMKPELKAEAEKRMKDAKKIVKARYINHRSKRERLTKPFCQYAGDPIDTWHFIPGEVYEVPKGLVDEVNANPGMPLRGEIVDTSGAPLQRNGAYEKIHEFVAASF